MGAGVTSDTAGSEARAPTSRRREQTRQRLLDAALTTFAAKGFGRATIEDVCETAGFTRGAFYSNFTSIDELFYALHEQRSEALLKGVVGAFASRWPDLRTTVTAVMNALGLDRDWVLVRGDFVMYAARNPEAAERLSAQRERLRGALAVRLEKRIDLERMPPAWRSGDALAQAAMTIHDGVMERLLLERDVEAARVALAQLLTALLRPA
jgi:AcrR family transcriptional regulator